LQTIGGIISTSMGPRLLSIGKTLLRKPMVRQLLLLMRRRLFWLTLLLAIWLLCSGQARAGELTQRLARFPDWSGQPALAAAEGDLIYPSWMQGTWSLTTTLVDMVAPLAPTVVTPGFEGNRALLQVPVRCQVRFVSVPQASPGLVPLLTGKYQVVADRAFNGVNLARAYLGDDVVKAVKVDPQNPNRQVTLLRAGRQLESTVSARGIEFSADHQFVTSELVQQVFRGRARPYFNRVETTTAYRQTETGIQADQVTAIYLSPQDPDFLTVRDRPVALYRYCLILTPENA
jgi:hypothetical protein